MIEQGLRFASPPAYDLVTPMALYYHVKFWENLLHNTLLEILCEIDTHHTGHMVCGNLLHVVLHHDLDKLLEGGGLWISTQFVLGLRGIAPWVHHIGGTIERLAHRDNDLACLDVNTLLVDAFSLPTELDARMMEG